MNTTETCVTLKDLRSATRYIVYVTASNEYGMSVPSARALAATNAIVTPTNSTLPQIERIPYSFVQIFVVPLTTSLRSIAEGLKRLPFSSTKKTFPLYKEFGIGRKPKIIVS